MKTLLYSAVVILLAVAASIPSQARISKDEKCSTCHTMHNSQAGQPMAQTLKSDFSGWNNDTTPNPSLLMYSCVGCHTNVGSDATIINDVPIVFNPSAGPDNPLAGGNFYYVTQNQANGHNVTVITSADTNFSGKNIPGSTTSYSGNQVTCAGQYGCHGNRSESDQLDAMKKTHHKDDTGGITGASAALSYRFLNGILGTEDSDWEQDNTKNSHNQYKGGTNFTTTSTMSYFCAQCHGNFHSDSGTGTASPWLRHPTDIVLPSVGEYQFYNGGLGGTGAADYSMIAPLARPNLTTITDPTKINPGTDIVMCLSCHRVHGSPNYKILRWNYKDWPGSGSNGCGICHTSKN